jgi:hypothetical protein
MRKHGGRGNILPHALEHFPVKYALGLDPGVHTGSLQKMRSPKEN